MSVAAKSALRERLLARRSDRPAAERATAAAALTAALLEGLAGARTFAAFVPDETSPATGGCPPPSPSSAPGCCCRSCPTAGAS